MSTYSEKLKNPLWQKKRLEILQRDEFTCKLCSDTQTELHVHHKSYKHGNDPWEYEDSNFETYCKFCHKLVEYYKHTDFEPIILGKKLNEEMDLVLITCIVYNKNTNIYGVDIRYFTQDGEVESYINLPEDTIKTISSLLDLSKKITNG